MESVVYENMIHIIAKPPHGQQSIQPVICNPAILTRCSSEQSNARNNIISDALDGSPRWRDSNLLPTLPLKFSQLLLIEERLITNERRWFSWELDLY